MFVWNTIIDNTNYEKEKEMKLRNNKTGEIIDIKDCLRLSDDFPNHYIIDSDWEDYEEPKRTWFIDPNCTPDYIDYGDNPVTDNCYDDWNELGICFETKEEAKKAVEKLKAWKRVSEDNFAFVDWYWEDKNVNENGSRYFSIIGVCDPSEISEDDLDLLFGGEE